MSVVSIRKAVVAGTFAAAALASATPALASELFAGRTDGCFATSPATCTATAGTGSTTATIGGLTFHSGAFSQLTDPDGNVSLGGTTDPLGQFTLTSSTYNYTTPGTFFDLLVTFVAPPGAAGSFTALLTGNVVANQTGGVHVNFSNNDSNPLYLTDANGGVFSFYVNDLDVPTGGAVNDGTGIISGHIQALPEPGAWAMMLLGFAGIGMVIRRTRASTLLPQLA